MKLGVFDSGIGGEAIAHALRLKFPQATIITINDRENLPYGTKSPDEVIRLTFSAVQPLLSQDCDVIVIACNTATAYAIEPLRVQYPHQKFIGIEPMVKTASQLTHSDIVAVCATPGTLKSERYQDLLSDYATGLTVLEPDCSTWASAIESNLVDKAQIQSTINTLCARGADVIVLGCTHYHWIKDLIQDASNGRARIIDPSQAIGQRVASLLKLS